MCRCPCLTDSGCQSETTRLHSHTHTSLLMNACAETFRAVKIFICEEERRDWEASFRNPSSIRDSFHEAWLFKINVHVYSKSPVSAHYMHTVYY